MLGFIAGLAVLVLAVVILTSKVWWPIYKVSQANDRRFWATLRENSAIGRRRAQNTYQMYLNLTKETYEYILSVCDGYNPFIDPACWTEYAEKYNSNPDHEKLESKTPFEHLEHCLKPVYKFVHGREAIVWIGWPWFDFETVKPWYLTALIKEVARPLKKGDRGGQEYHTVPMKVETFSFPLPIPDKERKELTDRIEKAREDPNDLAGKVSVTDLIRLMSLNPAETSDGFSIPVALEVDKITVGPWEMVTSVEFVLDQMYGLLNSALFSAMASVQALSKETLNQSEDKKDAPPASAEEIRSALMQKISDALQLTTGMAEADPKDATKLLRGPNGQPVKPQFKTLIEKVDDHRFAAVMAKMGEAILRIRLVNIEVPKELSDLLNQPARERAKMVADMVTANKRKAVAVVDADARETAGDGERRFQEQLAKGDKARLEAWDGQKPEVVAARLQEINADAWRDGVTKSGQGKVVITAGPNASGGGSSLEGAAAALGTVFQGASSGSSGKDEKGDKNKKDKKGDKPEGESKMPPAESSEDESPEE